MSVIWLWAGSVTSHGFRVRGEVNGDSIKLLVSVHENMADPLEFGPVAPITLSNHAIVTIDATGLLPETEYWYALEVDSQIDSNWKGRIPKTANRTGIPESFRYWAFSCAGNDNSESSTTSDVSNRGVFNNILAQSCDFGVHMGDLHYRDIETTDIAVHRAVYRDVLTFNQTEGSNALQGKLYRLSPTSLTCDDHEFGPSDSDKDSPGRAEFQQVYREMVPSHSLPASTSGGIWHSFLRGRVRFIVSDLRTERSSKTATDDINKVLMGDEQKAWFFDQIIQAKELNQAVCWVNPIPWIANQSSGADHWGGYSTHRQLITDFIVNNNMSNRLWVISGDMHALAIDDGRNNNWGGFPVFHFSSIDSNGSIKGGPYWRGPSTGRDRYGVMEIVDDGDVITITGTGFISSTTWNSYTFSIPLPSRIRHFDNTPSFPLTQNGNIWASASIRHISSSGWT